MATGTRPILKAIGIALIIVGAGSIVWGYQLSDSLGARATEAISGSMPDEVMIRYIVGAASLAVGLYLFLRR